MAVADFYRCLLDDTLTLARSLSDLEVAIDAPASDVEDLTQLVHGAASVVAQEGEGLAAGLTSVFAHFASRGQRVVAFNSDSPHLPVFWFLPARSKRLPGTTWWLDRHMMAAIILLEPRPPILRFSMVTAWAPRARLMRCWRALAGCCFPLASRIPSTTSTSRAT